MEFILMFALGWGIAYFFFRRKQKTQAVLFEKLAYDARRFLLKDPREKLGLTDVIDLFREKIIDEHLDLLGEPFPYKRCPHCGSKKIKRLVYRPDGTLETAPVPDAPPLAGETFKISCRSCGYRDSAPLRNPEDYSS